MDKKEILFKEIDIIQSIINRMWTNSFTIKGWTVMLVVWVIALDKFNQDNYLGLLVMALVAILILWWLDSYFLQQERLYRKLYKWVIENRATSDQYLFDMNPERLFRKEDCIVCVFFSKSVRPMYALLSIFVVIYCYFTL